MAHLMFYEKNSTLKFNPATVSAINLNKTLASNKISF